MGRRKCELCGGRGYVECGDYIVQLYEGESWNDWLDFKDIEAAVAEFPVHWGLHARIRKGKQIVFHGIPGQGEGL